MIGNLDGDFKNVSIIVWIAAIAPGLATPALRDQFDGPFSEAL
jgi:hypothetical protein